MNNKGFAITTLVYGLAIMGLLLISIIMATLSSTRRSIKDMSDEIEEELLNYSKNSVSFSAENGANHYYTVPDNESGYYRIELWGSKYNYLNTNGDYVTGIIYLEEKKRIYIYLDNTYTGKQSTVSANPNDLINSKIMIAAGGKNDSEQTRITGYPGHSYKYSLEGKDYYFRDGLVIKGISTKEGRAKITKISAGHGLDIDKSINGKYWKNVQYIKVAISGDGYNSANPCKIYYSYDGNPQEFDLTEGTKDGYGYYSGGASNHNYEDLRLYCPEYVIEKNLIFKVIIKGDTINQNSKEVKGSTEIGTIIYNGKYNGTDEEGVKLSAYQPNATSDIPKHGSYYIIPVANRTKVVTANEVGQAATKPLILSSIEGLNKQKWAIDKIIDTSENFYLYKNITTPKAIREFKIVEMSSNNAMDILYDDNTSGNLISAKKPFNTISRNDPQIWSLIPNEDGTYSIKTSVPSTDPSGKETGYLTYADDKLVIGFIDGSPTKEQRFILYSIDNSF